ncbi:halocyanin domain-containing protein, partial [Halobacteriales archaeon QS_1_68_17]
MKRRDFLRTAGGAAGGTAAAAAVPGSAVAQEGGSGPDFGGWFDDVGNFDGVVDRTGQSEVTVTVGAEGNGGAFAFAPAAVRVDPGTTVKFEWTGEGGGHNVIGEDNDLDSGDPVAESGVNYEYTFEEDGIYKYVCEPHLSLGMKGAVVVGGGGGGESGDGGGGSGGGSGGEPDYGDWFSDVGNFDGTTVDETGNSEVTVT